MSRYASSSHESLSKLGIVAHRYLADIGVTSGTIYACNGYRYLYVQANATTYTPTGLGQFAGIDNIREVSDNFPQGLRLWVAAMNSSQMYEPLREDMFNRPVTIYDAWLDPLSFTVIHTPEPVFAGKIDQLELRFADPQRGNYYELSAESEARREPVMAYFNKETLWANYSGDTFYDYQHLVPTVKAKWGQDDTSYADLGVKIPPPLYMGFPGSPGFRLPR